MISLRRKHTRLCMIILTFGSFILWCSNRNSKVTRRPDYSERHFVGRFISAASDTDMPGSARRRPERPVHSNMSSNSYRATLKPHPWMETNKINDDYYFCSRKEPFLGPFNYSRVTRNPCWYDGGRFRCVPNFYIVGFSKCGTTDLYNRILQHPQVVKTGAKEKHWFDYQRLKLDNGHIHNYTDKFSAAASVIEQDLRLQGSSNRITGDATPCYVWDSLKWRCYEGNENLTQPKYTNADHIYRLNPDAKIIVLMRDPVTRLYSRLLTWIKEPLHPVYVNSTPERFHDFIVERIAMYNQCFNTWSVRHCLYNGTLYQEAVLRLAEGIYYPYVDDWIKVFPANKLLFIKFEDYILNINETMMKVFSFLKLPLLPPDLMQKVIKAPIVNQGVFYNVGPMLNRTKRVLEDFYQPFNDALALSLADPLFTWDYMADRSDKD